MIQKSRERRRYPRHRVSCPASFLSYDRLRILETSDIGLGGVKVKSRYFLSTGETHNFTIVMNGRSITPRGGIVYVQSQPEFAYGVGVSFAHLSEDNRHQLGWFLVSQQIPALLAGKHGRFKISPIFHRQP